MTKELKEKLEQAMLGAGLDKGLLAFVSIESEDQIKGVVDNLTSLKTPKLSDDEILKLPIVQKYADRRVTEGIKKVESKISIPEAKSEGDSIEEKLAMLLEAKLSPLSEKLEGFQKEKSRDLKLQEARKALMGSKLPENIRESKLKYFNPDAEIEIEEWVKGQELEHEQLVQSLIDSGSLSRPVEVRNSNTEVDETQVDEILSKYVNK